MNQTRILWSVAEVCDRTGLGPTKVRSLIREGTLESVRIGKAIRIPADSLADFIARLRETP